MTRESEGRRCHGAGEELKRRAVYEHACAKAFRSCRAFPPPRELKITENARVGFFPIEVVSVRG